MRWSFVLTHVPTRLNVAVCTRTPTHYRATQSQQPRTLNRASQSHGATSDTPQGSSWSFLLCVRSKTAVQFRRAHQKTETFRAVQFRKEFSIAHDTQHTCLPAALFRVYSDKLSLFGTPCRNRQDLTLPLPLPKELYIG